MALTPAGCQNQLLVSRCQWPYALCVWPHARRQICRSHWHVQDAIEENFLNFLKASDCDPCTRLGDTTLTTFNGTNGTASARMIAAFSLPSLASGVPSISIELKSICTSPDKLGTINETTTNTSVWFCGPGGKGLEISSRSLRHPIRTSIWLPCLSIRSSTNIMSLVIPL